MPKSSMAFHVILRACDKVSSVHGFVRPFGLNKAEMIRACFKSLLDSLPALETGIRRVIGDGLSEDLATWFESKGATVDRLSGLGNDGSLDAAFNAALTLPDEDWVYLLEDDYLHHETFGAEVRFLLDHRKERLRTEPRSSLLRLLFGDLSERELFLFPADYPDFYAPDRVQPSVIFLGEGRHWRQVPSTTFTLITQVKSLRRHERLFRSSFHGARDGTLSRSLYARFLYGDWFFRNRALCLAPIPSLASHMHTATLAPLVDWSARLESIRAR